MAHAVEVLNYCYGTSTGGETIRRPKTGYVLPTVSRFSARLA